ncbi:hypothetical protein KA093_02255 [Candidatus Saccharibacteria bacterium]|nr:hypothetical protein [Candidatus Saccharibacteria bacterium]
MIKNLFRILREKWPVVLAVVVMVGILPAYALVSSIFNSEEKIDAPMSTDARTVSDNEKNSNKTEQSSDANSSIQETTEPPVASTQQGSSSANPAQPTPATNEIQPPQASTADPVPSTSYINGSGAWWADKRWVESGYTTQYLGETCSSWKTGAQATGLSLVAGPDLHRVLCQDTAGYSLFGFIEQVRPDGYVVSAYNWAGEAGPKQLVMTSFNGFSFFAPKQVTN